MVTDGLAICLSGLCPVLLSAVTIAVVNKVEHVERACETAASLMFASHAQTVTIKGLKERECDRLLLLSGHPGFAAHGGGPLQQHADGSSALGNGRRRQQRAGAVAALLPARSGCWPGRGRRHTASLASILPVAVLRALLSLSRCFHARMRLWHPQHGNTEVGAAASQCCFASPGVDAFTVAGVGCASVLSWFLLASHNGRVSLNACHCSFTRGSHTLSRAGHSANTCRPMRTQF